jgi:hypothetical protein
MVLEWREREHEEVDATVERDTGAQLALKICGIYKFWALKGMRARRSSGSSRSSDQGISPIRETNLICI